MYLPIITTAAAIESQVCELDIASSSISHILLILLRGERKALRRLKLYLHEIRYVVLLLRRWPPVRHGMVSLLAHEATHQAFK